MDNNTQSNIEDIVGLTDLIPTLDGPDAETEAGLYKYIIKTRGIIASKPEIFTTQQDARQMLEMFDYLIENWDTDRIRAIAVLAEKEMDLLSKGFISYDTSDLNISDVAETSGFFSVLAELYEDEIDELDELNDELDGLFKKLREKRKKKKELKKSLSKEEWKQHKKDKRRKIIGKLNKFNPLTLAVRNALRGLLALNLFGIATTMMRDDPKAKEVLAKVVRMYKTMGGKEDKLMQTLNKAKGRKALFNKKVQQEVEAGKFKGTEGFGSTTAIGGMLLAAGKFLLKIWNWIKGAGFKLKPEQIQKIAEKFAEGKPEETPTDTDTDTYTETDTIQYGGKSKDVSIKTGTDEKKWKKPLIIVGILALAGGVTYGIIEYNKKKAKPDNKKVPGKKVSNKGKKLSGIQLK